MSAGQTQFNITVRLIVAVSLLGAGWGVAGAYEAIAVKDAGTIVGMVKFVGVPPVPELLEVTRDRDACGVDFHFSESLVVSEAGGIQNAVVSLQGIAQGEAYPKRDDNITLVQENCWFNPHVLLIPADSTVELRNHDETMHHIRTVSQINPVVNMVQPGYKKRLRIVLREPEIIQVHCDLHPWMTAWFVVTGHPYHMVTDANGSFALNHIPPGTYTLHVWHETLGTQSQAVKVSANRATKVVVEMKPKAPF